MDTVCRNGTLFACALPPQRSPTALPGGCSALASGHSSQEAAAGNLDAPQEHPGAVDCPAVARGLGERAEDALLHVEDLILGAARRVDGLARDVRLRLDEPQEIVALLELAEDLAATVERWISRQGHAELRAALKVSPREQASGVVLEVVGLEDRPERQQPLAVLVLECTGKHDLLQPGDAAALYQAAWLEPFEERAAIGRALPCGELTDVARHERQEALDALWRVFSVQAEHHPTTHGCVLQDFERRHVGRVREALDHPHVDEDPLGHARPRRVHGRCYAGRCSRRRFCLGSLAGGGGRKGSSECGASTY